MLQLNRLDFFYVVMNSMMPLHVILLRTTLSCVPEYPCRTCDDVTVDRDATDCRIYVYCYYGHVWTSKRCGSGQIYSQKVSACVSENTTNECPSSMHVAPSPSTNKPNQEDLRTLQELTSGRITSRDKIDWPFSKRCGIKAANRIVGGQGAEPGEWAWQVSLQSNYRLVGKRVHYCGGTLIDTSWVLTAAHCVYGRDPSQLQIVVGAYNLILRQPDEQTLGVSRIITYPNYRNYGNYPNDIALLHLESAVKLTRSSNIVCLPAPGEDIVVDQSIDGVAYSTTGCWTTGWGISRRMGHVYSLNEIKVQLIDQKTCSNSWSEYLRDFHICAGSGAAGTCRGDSGGPLVCSKHGRFYLVGVVSWGEDTCLLKDYPNVFTRVSRYTDWIYQVMRTMQAL